MRASLSSCETGWTSEGTEQACERQRWMRCRQAVSGVGSLGSLEGGRAAVSSSRVGRAVMVISIDLNAQAVVLC